MSRGMKIGLIGVTVALVAGGAVAFRINEEKNAGTEVRMEQVGRRDLVSAVTASGKIEPKTKVDISADITGRIIRIAVREGEVVKKGQFLIQIDPAQYQAAVSQAEGAVASTRATLVQTRASRDQAERTWKRARELTRLGPNLIAPAAAEDAQTAFDVAEATYQATQAQLLQSQAGLREARDNLAKTRLTSPIAGRVVRLAVEEGEVAVPGTFSRETGLLMTIADLSVILAKVQVDETDVVRLAANDSVEVTIDAYPDTTFVGRVTEVSHSAQLTATETASGSNDRAVDFDVEVTLDHPPPDIRPDLSCTARIVTETRGNALSIPIIALTVRDHEPVPNESAPMVDTNSNRRRDREEEGVFVVRDGVATFRAVRVGIAGDEYFEVVSGLRQGETIVAGTYQAIRDLEDSGKVRQADTTERAPAES
ncbi:MAG: efflux RND transporter periplasmic adaptor subunit [Gemmatimonadales bacterium]|nr:efflux RND transporter periplasmic adaptor subunit [Gemmatimonadales bacterium]MDQ3222159.1 efflux RND transporter periplasmic adaptor subunit [Gemmatimonadota bacterium]